MSYTSLTKEQLIDLIESQVVTINGQETKIATHIEAIKELEARLVTAKDYEKILSTQLTNTEKQLTDLTAAKDKQETDLMAVIGELQSEVTRKETQAKGPHTVTLTKAGEETRSFVVTCQHYIWNGEKLPAATITDNSEMLQELVTLGAGILQEIHS
ncbi:MAG: hypothetical protein ACO1OF_16420 [Adhaeribacter sp.]